jgi:hypothetical protein
MSDGSLLQKRIMATSSSSPPSATPTSSIQLVADPPFQACNFESFKPSRFDHIYLFDEKNKTHCRYHLLVVDCPTTNVTRPTAVFLIPAGRESEYLFSSQKGLWSVAESAQCARLIAVALGRFHEFENESVVTSELVWVIQVLGQQGRFLSSRAQQQHANSHSNSSIPILKMDGIGHRNILAQGETSLSGPYLIEQVKLDDRVVRRLYFMDNPFVIQSEVVMLPQQQEQHLGNETMATATIVDKSQLAFEYHHYMAAGILSLAKLPKKQQQNDTNAKGVIIGLGGAGLVNFLQHILDWVELTVIELDPTVVAVAERYFGFTAADTRVVVGDGLRMKASSVVSSMASLAITNTDNDDDEEEVVRLSNNNDSTPSTSAVAATPILFPKHSLSFIVIDVDSKDKTVGMSCPPLSFCQPDYLQQLKPMLKPDEGLLVVNVSARDPKLFHQVCQTIRTVFGSVMVASHDDSDDEDNEHEKAVNVSLFARPNDATSNITTPVAIPSDDSLMQLMKQCLSSSRQKLDDDMLSVLLSCLSSFSMYDMMEDDFADGQIDTNSVKKKKKKKKPSRKKGRR